jgi:uncharacterized protein YfbU (UPF0304 family)
MFDGKEKKEPTYHRIYVEFEGGYWISLGVLDKKFQEMVEDLGRPLLVQFRDTDEKWLTADEEVAPGETVETQ